jgi:hypothetical protein
MRNKEIKEKFEKLNKRIESLETVQKDHYDSIQFLVDVVKKYSDEPIFRIRLNDNWYKGFFVKENVLQYIYANRIKEITTSKPILYAELFAYCDTHFILKNTSGEYFLVSMGGETITDIPIQLLFSKEMNLTIEGQVLKVCHTESGVLGVRND